MPGSRRPVAYFTDDGTEMYMVLDESIAESLSLGFGVSITAAVAADPCRRLSPSNKFPIEPRFVSASRVDGDGRVIKRDFYVGATSAPIWTGSPYGVTVDGETWDISARTGEVRHYIPAQDTGLIDGDVDNNITAAV